MPNVTFSEFKDGTDYGYRWTDASKGNNSQSLDLWVSVGDRFKIRNRGIDHVRMDMVDALYGMIPVAQLAGVR